MFGFLVFFLLVVFCYLTKVIFHPSFFFFLPVLSLLPLICHTYWEEANLCSSEICEYIVRNVCPSWHYNTLYQPTRGVGGWGLRGSEENKRRMLRCNVWGEKKKRSSLWPFIWQDVKQLNDFGIWLNSFLQSTFGARGILWHEAACA